MKELRFILIGKTGEGKSATGNLILQRRHFVSRTDFSSVTQEVAFASEFLHMHNRTVTVVDTPGLFDNNRAMLEVAIDIQGSLEHVMPGPHAFLLVIRFCRFTAEDEHALDMLKIMFGKMFASFTIIIFTNVENEETFRTLLNGNNHLRRILAECRGRYITVNNSEGNTRRNASALIRLVELADTVSDRGNKHYAENIRIYKDVLEAHVRDWSENHLTSDQLQTILKEQEEKRQMEIAKKIGIGAAKVGAVGLGMAIGGVIGFIVPGGGPIAGAVVGAKVATGVVVGGASVGGIFAVSHITKRRK